MPISLLAYRLISLFFILCLICSCSQKPELAGIISYQEKQLAPFDLAMRFAPRLYTNPTEPYGLMDLVVVVHPQRPLIAYHLLWEDDSIGAGIGMEGDHEIAWVEYDPISLKLVDMWVLWHRGILHTTQAITEAKSHNQRPKLLIQWGQHGILPVGWESLPTARPEVELRLHFSIMKLVQTGPYTGSKDIDSLKFQGDYSEYLTFSELIDSREHIQPEKVVVGIDGNAIMSQLVHFTISLKQPWPY
jgi:hypothetical protein